MSEPREKPLVLYDGDCSFCRIWVGYLEARTAGNVDYAPADRALEAVELVLPNGTIRSGAEAVYGTLGYAGAPFWTILYKRLPLFSSAAEAAYRFIARHRPLFWHLTRFAFGREVRPLRYDTVEQLFLKLLGVIYLIAFVSFGVQASGLIGSNGILPLGSFLGRASEMLGASAWHRFPTLFWLSAGDAAIRGAWIAGTVCGVLIIAGFFARPALIAAFALYLSITVGGQDFLEFQWDSLLLEVGSLAIFLGWSRGVVWLYRWLLFRLMFESGAVKLMGGDPTWRHLTALTFHYHTQPLPTPLAWYADHLPAGFQAFSCAVMFAIELGLPWLIFAPRRLRHFAACGLILLQVLIALTGNYAFFNLLTVALCLFLFDDRLLRGWPKPRGTRVPPRLRRTLTGAVAALALTTGAFELEYLFRGSVPAPAWQLMSAVAPFRIVNLYGLFEMMTTNRNEIEVEGSNDGVAWRAYEFRYKAGPLGRRPGWAAPHQPRLDWQMWFAALGNFRSNPWFVNFLARLLEGSPEVLGLLERNPFPGRPPRFVRALIYEYRFTSPEEKRRTGNWWTRMLLGTYLRPISLDDLRR